MRASSAPMLAMTADADDDPDDEESATAGGTWLVTSATATSARTDSSRNRVHDPTAESPDARMDRIGVLSDILNSSRWTWLKLTAPVSLTIVIHFFP